MIKRIILAVIGGFAAAFVTAFVIRLIDGAPGAAARIMREADEISEDDIEALLRELSSMT
jgi:flagellar motor component MotA